MTEAEEAAAAWGAVTGRLLVERENAVWQVRLPGGVPAALRLHRPGYQSEGAIRSELWWCGALAAQGVAVPAPVPTLSGGVLHRLAGGRLASVVGWIEGAAIGASGVPLPGSEADQRRLHRDLGRLLARVHAVTDRLELPEWFRRPSWDFNGLLGEAPFWGRFWEHPALAPDEARVLRRARDWLAARIGEHAAREPLRPIHADVLRENVLAGPGGLSIIDFDDSGMGYRLYDLGTALSQCLYEPAYPAIRAALMEGYGTDDGAMVNAFTVMRCCASVGWTMPRLPPDSPIHRSHIARAVMAAERFGAAGRTLP
ncbi:MAG: phosphotransferase [Paracoccaceae bacterium]|nr:MAG: phosphotransferase [Paracoccaceae bacterium]